MPPSSFSMRSASVTTVPLSDTWHSLMEEHTSRVSEMPARARAAPRPASASHLGWRYARGVTRARVVQPRYVFDL